MRAVAETARRQSANFCFLVMHPGSLSSPDVPRHHQGRSYALTGAPSPVLAFHQGQELPDLGKQNSLFTSSPVLVPHLKATIYLFLKPPVYSPSPGMVSWDVEDTVGKKRLSTGRGNFRARQIFKGRQYEARHRRTNEYYVLWWSTKPLKSICLPENLPYQDHKETIHW